MKNCSSFLVWLLIASVHIHCHVDAVPSAPGGRPAVLCTAPDACVIKDGDTVIEDAAIYQDYAGTTNAKCPPSPRLCHLRLLADLYDPMARTWLRDAVCVRPPGVERPELDAWPACYSAE